MSTHSYSKSTLLLLSRYLWFETVVTTDHKINTEFYCSPLYAGNIIYNTNIRAFGLRKVLREERGFEVQLNLNYGQTEAFFMVWKVYNSDWLDFVPTSQPTPKSVYLFDFRCSDNAIFGCTVYLTTLNHVVFWAYPTINKKKKRFWCELRSRPKVQLIWGVDFSSHKLLHMEQWSLNFRSWLSDFTFWRVFD